MTLALMFSYCQTEARPKTEALKARVKAVGLMRLPQPTGGRFVGDSSIRGREKSCRKE
jgi:hypothetical protein